MTSPIDFFAVLGVPRRLDLDVHTLEPIYYRLSREVHPDFHHNKPEAERAEMLERSALVNQAYRTLRDFHSRAAYLVELEGAGTLKPQAPPELLEEVLEIQDLLEEVRSLERTSPTERDALTGRLRDEQQRLRTRLATLDATLKQRALEWDSALESPNETGASAQRDVLRAVQDLLSQRVYLTNLLRDLEAASTPVS